MKNGISRRHTRFFRGQHMEFKIERHGPRSQYEMKMWFQKKKIKKAHEFKETKLQKFRSEPRFKQKKKCEGCVPASQSPFSLLEDEVERNMKVRHGKSQ